MTSVSRSGIALRVAARRMTTLVLVLTAVTVTATATATAETPVALSTVTTSNLYSWCGASALNSLLPDATPPSIPTGCGLYSGPGANSSLTATLGAHAGGSITVSVYVHNAARPVTLGLVVNGAAVGAVLHPASSTTGWTTFPAIVVGSTDQVQVYAKVGWYGTGGVTINAIHAGFSAWTSPDWSQLGSPGNWATTPIPSNVTTASGTSPQNGLPLNTEVPRELAGQAAADAYVDMSAFTEGTYYQPLSTPLQPVRLCRSSSSCVPSWGGQVDDLWKAALGLPNNATMDRTTGKCLTNCTSIGGGIPVTANVDPSPGSDKAAVACLGGGDSGDPPWTLLNANGTPFVRPDGQEIQGNCWELWGLQPDPTYNSSQPVGPNNTKWMFAWGAHRTGFITQPFSTPNTTYGYSLDTLSGQYCPRSAAGEWKCNGVTDALAQQWFGPGVLTPGAANSTTYELGWGVTGSELPLLTDAVQQNDCQRILSGVATDFGHAIGVQVQYSRSIGSGLHVAWWPAGASDGTNSHMATVEGMRLWFPPSVTMPSNLSSSAQAFFRTVQKYGIVVDDTTAGGPAITYRSDGSYASGGALNTRVALPTAGTNYCSTLGMQSALVGIPWSRLQLILEGWDGGANPTG